MCLRLSIQGFEHEKVRVSWENTEFIGIDLISSCIRNFILKETTLSRSYVYRKQPSISHGKGASDSLGFPHSMINASLWIIFAGHIKSDRPYSIVGYCAPLVSRERERSPVRIWLRANPLVFLLLKTFSFYQTPVFRPSNRLSISRASFWVEIITPSSKLRYPSMFEGKTLIWDLKDE